MLVITRSSISAVQLQTNGTVMFIDMMPGTAKHIRIGNLAMGMRVVTGQYMEADAVNKNEAFFPITGEDCIMRRHSKDILAIKVADKDPVYYELGEPALDILTESFPALAAWK